MNHDEEEGHVHVEGLALVVFRDDSPAVVGENVASESYHIVRCCGGTWQQTNCIANQQTRELAG